MGVTALETLAEIAHPGAAIRERRIELGWTQTELGERAEVPQADISRIENGHLDARWSTIQRISQALATKDGPKRSLASPNHHRPQTRKDLETERPDPAPRLGRE